MASDMLASRARRTEAAGSAGEEQDLPVGKDRSGVYRYVGLGIWLLISTLMVFDRFYWNVWPRQSICTDGCGGDFFCDMDDDPGCLKDGPWSAKVFDAVARISARLIISTTNLMFITMCHGTWNWLSEINMLRSLLYSWRGDNAWLHTIGGWTLGVWTLLHVWTLFLPSMFHGYQNNVVGGPLDIPLQVTLKASNVDVENKLANWGYDDVWRLIWMTLIYGMLIPLSRSVWALKKNFSLAMWLHIGVGMGYFFDNWRRKTHPHVWILNTPVVLWYIVDKIWCCTAGRVDHRAETTRITLDEHYMLLLWQEDQPKSICDIFWLKHRDRDSKGSRRTGEVAHPFTTCSSHDTALGRTSPEEAGTSAGRSPGRHSIEVPIDTDVNWKGHRFLLTSRISQRSNALESTLRSSRAFYGTRDLSVAIKDDKVVVQPRGGGKGAASNVDLGTSTKWQMANVGTLDANSSGAFSEHSPFQVDKSGHELAKKEYHVNCPEADEEDNEGEEETMIGIKADDAEDEVAVVVGTLEPKTNLTGDCSLISDSVEHLFEQDLIYNNTVSSAVEQNINRDLEEAGDDGEKLTKKIVVRRLGTREFHAFRKVESAEGRVGPVMTRSWSKMAIVRINRRTSQNSTCTCIGLTWALDMIRTPETASIADIEGANDRETIPLRVYGPYRSEYGRLEEFPNLPPLLIIATGAGAGLVLDFVGFVRAKKITPKRPVKVCYSSASLALLQFVTNTLLTERTPGIQIETALTRHEELEMFNTTNQPKPELVLGRLDVKTIIRGASQDTEVYFCGGGGINTLLRETCAKRRMKYVGSSVQ